MCYRVFKHISCSFDSKHKSKATFNIHVLAVVPITPKFLQIRRFRMIGCESLQHLFGTKTGRSRVWRILTYLGATGCGSPDSLWTLWLPRNLAGITLPWRIRPTLALGQGTKGPRAPDLLEEIASSTISLPELKLAVPHPLSLPNHPTTRREIAPPPQWIGRNLSPSSRPSRPRSL